MVKQALKIVEACEQEDARSLVESVNSFLTGRLVKHVDGVKRVIGSKLLGENVADVNSGSWVDRFESYSPEIQEAIEEVADRVEKGEDIEECMLQTAEYRGVPKEKLKEFFDHVLGEDSITVDSTKETGSKTTKNRERMDDEDVSKRVRFESVATAKDVVEAIVKVRGIEFDSGEKGVRITEEQANAIQTVFQNLNESNQETMVNKMTADRTGFIEMVSWCVKATK